MRVLFTSIPQVGHVNPMLPLAQAFRERGDDVLWATPAEARQRVEQAGIPVAVAGQMGDRKPGPAHVARHPEIAALPPAEQPDHVFPAIFGYERTAPMLADLVPLVEAWQPQLVIREAAEFAAPIAAARVGVPCLTHAFGALSPEVRVARASASVAPLWEANGLVPRPYGGSYDHLYLDIYPPSLQSQERPHVRATQLLRNVVLPSAGAAVTSAPAFLAAAAGRPVVYVTLGTIFNDAGALRAVVAGVRDLDVFVVVTVGPDRAVGAIGPQPDNVHVASYVPQDELLPHCTAVVSHAGSGTFLATLGFGLPQLCVPLGADQFLNAQACVHAGAGLLVPPDAVAVRAALARLLEERSFADAAAGVARDLGAMPSPAEVAGLLASRWG